MYFILLFVIALSLWLLVWRQVSKRISTKSIKKWWGYVIVPTLIFLVNFSGFLYFKYDHDRSVYGLSCIFCAKSMPFGISAKSGDYANGLVLVDDADFELVDKGFKYEHTDFKMNDFLAYSYNDTSILVKCTDSLKNIHYLISYKTGYRSKKGNDELSFRELSKLNFKRIQGNYRWVVLDEEHIKDITVKRSASLIGLGVFLVLLFVAVLKVLKFKSN